MATSGNEPWVVGVVMHRKCQWTQECVVSASTKNKQHTLPLQAVIVLATTGVQNKLNSHLWRRPYGTKHKRLFSAAWMSNAQPMVQKNSTCHLGTSLKVTHGNVAKYDVPQNFSHHFQCPLPPAAETALAQCPIKFRPLVQRDFSAALTMIGTATVDG